MVKKRVGENPTEEYDHIRLATYLLKKNILFFHCPNGGKRSCREAVKFKRMGVMAGIPDFVIPVARKDYHGLYLELKRKVGSNTSDNQKWWINRLNAEGYRAIITFGFDEAVLAIENYFDEI